MCKRVVCAAGAGAAVVMVAGVPQALLQRQMASKCGDGDCTTLMSVARSVMSGVMEPVSGNALAEVTAALVAVLGILMVVCVFVGAVRVKLGSPGGLQQMAAGLMVPFAVVVIFGVVL